VPDWLSVADREVRIRRRHLTAAIADAGPEDLQLLRGIQQHLDDDAWFHETRAFAELSLALAADVRDVLAEPQGLRPAFLGHLLVEVLLDAALIAQNSARLDDYYRLLETVDPARIQGVVNRTAQRPTERLAGMIRLFCREGILWDYLDDGKLLRRLNQVMRRVGLAELPEGFVGLLPTARHLVQCRKAELLSPSSDALPRR
jgi:hypothetical protein